MLPQILIKNATIVNEGKQRQGDVLIEGELIKAIGLDLHEPENAHVIDATGLRLLPGVIDDQVHFREPGLTHKGDIATESRAAVAGGITSFMEMPNTAPATTTQELLHQKFKLAAEHSVANFSFYMGATNDNLDEVLLTDRDSVCGIKIFMGSSTGNMLVDNSSTLEKIFAECEMLIATHCEDEATIKGNMAKYSTVENIDASYHPIIRNEEACYKSSSIAVKLAKKYNTRLHILHISTAKELELFDNAIPLSEKRITAEACVHHLWFNDKDYASKGNFIKWNPAIKSEKDRAAILEAVKSGKIDIIATDHAPHTFQEKQQEYMKAPSGGPLVQHSLVAMLELSHRNEISIEKVVEKMCHAPAECFQVEKRGYIKEGYFADLVLVDLNHPWKVEKENILYKCGWSPFEGVTFSSRITHTFVNGHLAYAHGSIDDSVRGKRLTFNRE